VEGKGRSGAAGRWSGARAAPAWIAFRSMGGATICRSSGRSMCLLNRNPAACAFGESLPCRRDSAGAHRNTKTSKKEAIVTSQRRHGATIRRDGIGRRIRNRNVIRAAEHRARQQFIRAR
jgi:hypothetical protein